MTTTAIQHHTEQLRALLAAVDAATLTAWAADEERHPVTRELAAEALSTRTDH